MRSGTAYPQPPSAPLTRVTASTSLLPTPTASEYGSSQNGINGLGGENERPSANRPSLSTMARRELLPTPLAADHRSGPNAYGGDRGDGTRSEKLAHAASRLPTPTSRSENQAQGRGHSEERSGETLMQAATRLPTPTTRPEDHRSNHDMQGPTLMEAASALIPTPTASNARQGARKRRDRQEGPNLIEWSKERLPTPMAADSGRGSGSYARGNPTLLGAVGVKPVSTPVSRDHKGTGYANQLPTELARLQGRLSLPTPTAKDSVASGVAGNWTEESGRNPGATLTDVVVRGLDTPSRSRTSPPASASNSPPSATSAPSDGTGGTRLSPCFVEWMMGWPVGWTATGPWSSTSQGTDRSGSTSATATAPTTPTDSTPAATASPTSAQPSPGSSSGTASTPGDAYDREVFDAGEAAALVARGWEVDLALYHLPEGAAGDRLRRITQLHAFTYLGLWRANLCAGKWSAPRARERAHRLLSGPFHLSADSPEWRPWDTVVMLGRKVARSFAAVLRATAAVEPFNAAVFTVHGLPVTLVSLPHPSGLSRAWNDPDAPGSARATLRAHAPGVPWGEDPSL